MTDQKEQEQQWTQVGRAYFPGGVRVIMKSTTEEGDVYAHSDMFMRTEKIVTYGDIPAECEQIDRIITTQTSSPVTLKWLRRKSGWRKGKLKWYLQEGVRMNLFKRITKSTLRHPLYDIVNRKKPQKPTLLTCTPVCSTEIRSRTKMCDNIQVTVDVCTGFKMKNPFRWDVVKLSDGTPVLVATKGIITRACHETLMSTLRNEIPEQLIQNYEGQNALFTTLGTCVKTAHSLVISDPHIHGADGCEMLILAHAGNKWCGLQLGTFQCHSDNETLHNTTSHWIATNAEEKARILESDPDSLNGPAQYGDLIAGFLPYSRILGCKDFKYALAEPDMFEIDSDCTLHITIPEQQGAWLRARLATL